MYVACITLGARTRCRRHERLWVMGTFSWLEGLKAQWDSNPGQGLSPSGKQIWCSVYLACGYQTFYEFSNRSSNKTFDANWLPIPQLAKINLISTISVTLRDWGWPLRWLGSLEYVSRSQPLRLFVSWQSCTVTTVDLVLKHALCHVAISANHLPALAAKVGNQTVPFHGIRTDYRCVSWRCLRGAVQTAPGIFTPLPL